MDSASKPLRPRRLGQLPTAWGAFCAGFAREKASSRSGEVTSEAKSEGLLALAPAVPLPHTGRSTSSSPSFPQPKSAAA